MGRPSLATSSDRIPDTPGPERVAALARARQQRRRLREDHLRGRYVTSIGPADGIDPTQTGHATNPRVSSSEEVPESGEKTVRGDLEELARQAGYDELAVEPHARRPQAHGNRIDAFPPPANVGEEDDEVSVGTESRQSSPDLTMTDAGFHDADDDGDTAMLDTVDDEGSYPGSDEEELGSRGSRRSPRPLREPQDQFDSLDDFYLSNIPVNAVNDEVREDAGSSPVASAPLIATNIQVSEWTFGTQPRSSTLQQDQGQDRGSGRNPSQPTRVAPVIPTETPTDESYRQRFREAVAARDGARMLLYHLKVFQGCTVTEHYEDHRSHEQEYAEAAITHNRLKDLTDNNNTYPVLPAPAMLSPRDVSVERTNVDSLVRHFQGRPAFQGPGQYDEPRHVCIHRSHCGNIAPDSISFDWDSHFGYPSSLGAFRTGIDIFEIPPTVHQQKTNLHARPTAESAGIFNPETDQFLKLDSAVHLCFAHVPDLDVFVYIYFPLIPNRESTFLTRDELERFTNLVVLPSIKKVCPSDVHSAFPGSYHAAELRVTASSAERGSRLTHGRQTRLAHHLGGQYLSRVWSAMLHYIERSESLACFRDAQLFFTAKNHKYKFREATLTKVLRAAHEKIYQLYDLELVDDMILDLAKEVTPPRKPLALSSFFRRCCIKKALPDLFTHMDGQKPSPSKCMSVYNHCGLRDLTNFTATPPSASIMAHWGVLYVQHYSQTKQAVDVAKVYPWMDSSLDPLAVGKQRAEGHAKSGKTTIDFAAIEESWCHSKNRVDEEARGTRRESPHSAREEWRMTLGASFELLEVSEEDDERNVDSPSQDPRTALTPLWSIPTNEFFLFMWSVLNSRCAYFEKVLAQHNNRPSTETIRVLLLFLGMLRIFVQAVNIPTRREFWLRSTRSDRRLEMGAGFSHTMMRYGFCWIDDVMDWATHSFRPDIRSVMVFDHRAVLGRYIAHRGEIMEEDELEDAIRQCKLIASTWRVAPVHKYILNVMTFFVIQQFKADILDSISKDFPPSTRAAQSVSRFTWTWKNVDEQCPGQAFLVGKSFSGRKTTTYSGNPRGLMDRFFGDLNQDVAPTAQREHFHRAAYRRLAWEAEKVVLEGHFVGCKESSSFQESLRDRCLASFRVLPAPEPSSRGLTQKTRPPGDIMGTQRRWIAVNHSKAPVKGGVFNPHTKAYVCLGGSPSQFETVYTPEDRALQKHPRTVIDQFIQRTEDAYGLRHGIGRGLRIRERGRR